jgi:hypothetical protein
MQQMADDNVRVPREALPFDARVEVRGATQPWAGRSFSQGRMEMNRLYNSVV